MKEKKRGNGEPFPRAVWIVFDELDGHKTYGTFASAKKAYKRFCREGGRWAFEELAGPIKYVRG